jgi:hypothetical protein
MLTHDQFDEYYSDEITLEKALIRVAPLFVNSLIRKHPSLMLAIVLADVALEVRNNRKAKRKFGELVLIKS